MKRMVLTLLVVVVGVFVISSITATNLLQNSHTFRETATDSSFCEKCHTDQVEAMAATAGNGNHGAITECRMCHPKGDDDHAVAADAACENCHSGALSELEGSNEAHAGMLDSEDATVACISCHTTHDSSVTANYDESTEWSMG